MEVRCFFFSSRRRHTRYWRDWSSDVCSSDLADRDRGVPELLDGALDALNGDHVPYLGAVLDVAPGCYVAGEQGEPLAQREGGDEADRGEHDHGYEHQDVGLET